MHKGNTPHIQKLHSVILSDVTAVDDTQNKKKSALAVCFEILKAVSQQIPNKIGIYLFIGEAPRPKIPFFLCPLPAAARRVG